MLKLKTGKDISVKEINLVISRFLQEVIEENTPYIWYSTETPFYNIYSDKISYDYSGEVRKMTYDELIDIKDNLGKSEVAYMFYNSKLEELLKEIRINRSEAIYVSNCGLHWVNYENLLEEKFRDWKYDSFDIYDPIAEEDDEELDMQVDDIYQDFLENTSHELYYKKILSKLRQEL